MNGLTKSELNKLRAIRALAARDLDAAKRQASKWAAANKQRRGIRRAALSTVRGLRSRSFPWSPDYTSLVINAEERRP